MSIAWFANLGMFGGGPPPGPVVGSGGMSIGTARPWYADYSGVGEGGLGLGGSTSAVVPFGPSASGGARLSGVAGIVYSPTGDWASQVVIGGLKSQALVTGGYRLGFNTHTIVAAGGHGVGGAATRSIAAIAAAEGGVGVGGEAEITPGGVTLISKIVVSGLLDGTLVTGGFIAAGQTNIEAGSGGVSLGGVAARQHQTSRVGSGGMRFGGLSPTNFPSLFEGVGGTRFGGTAARQAGLIYQVTGGMKFGGEVLVAVPNPKITASRMIVSARIL